MPCRRQQVARGCHDPRDTAKEWPQVVVRFDRETFDQIREIAIKNKVSFAEQLRELVEFGLEALETA